MGHCEAATTWYNTTKCSKCPQPSCSMILCLVTLLVVGPRGGLTLTFDVSWPLMQATTYLYPFSNTQGIAKDSWVLWKKFNLGPPWPVCFSYVPPKVITPTSYPDCAVTSLIPLVSVLCGLLQCGHHGLSSSFSSTLTPLSTKQL